MTHGDGIWTNLPNLLQNCSHINFPLVALIRMLSYVRIFWEVLFPKRCGSSCERSVLEALIQLMFLSKRPLESYLPQTGVFYVTNVVNPLWHTGLLWLCSIILGENLIVLQLSSGLPKWPLFLLGMLIIGHLFKNNEAIVWTFNIKALLWLIQNEWYQCIFKDRET